MTAAKSLLIQNYSSPQYAHVARSMLVAQGLECWVTGDQMATTLSYYGAALSQVELWVKAEDVDQATQILAELAPEDRGVDRWGLDDRRCWQCTSCLEPNEPSFDECWSCSNKRTDDAVLVAIDQPLPPEAVGLPAQPQMPTDIADDSLYCTPTVASESVQPPLPVPENLTARAFRAMIFGIVFPIPVMFFAAYFSFQAFQREPHSWRLWAALLISVPMTLVAVVLLIGFTGNVFLSQF